MESSELDSLYTKDIRKHALTPENNAKLDSPDVEGYAINPFCGDEVYLQANISNSQIINIGVQTIGCSINSASGSIMSYTILNKNEVEINCLYDTFKVFLSNSNLSNNKLADLGDLSILSNLRSFPIRIKCALVSWSALDDLVNSDKEI